MILCLCLSLWPEDAQLSLSLGGDWTAPAAAAAVMTIIDMLAMGLTDQLTSSLVQSRRWDNFQVKWGRLDVPLSSFLESLNGSPQSNNYKRRLCWTGLTDSLTTQCDYGDDSDFLGGQGECPAFTPLTRSVSRFISGDPTGRAAVVVFVAVAPNRTEHV